MIIQILLTLFFICISFILVSLFFSNKCETTDWSECIDNKQRRKLKYYTPLCKIVNLENSCISIQPIAPPKIPTVLPTLPVVSPTTIPPLNIKTNLDEKTYYLYATAHNNPDNISINSSVKGTEENDCLFPYVIVQSNTIPFIPILSLINDGEPEKIYSFKKIRDNIYTISINNFYLYRDLLDTTTIPRNQNIKLVKPLDITQSTVDVKTDPNFHWHIISNNKDTYYILSSDDTVSLKVSNSLYTIAVDKAPKDIWTITEKFIL